MIDLGLVPVGAVRFADAFARWADQRRPSDAEILAHRVADLTEALAGAEADGRETAALAAALLHLRIASPRQRAQMARFLWSCSLPELQLAFLGHLRAGRPRCRIFADGIECEVDPVAFGRLDYKQAAAMLFYFDEPGLDAWLRAAAGSNHHERHHALVAFLRQRAGDSVPTEAADHAAAMEGFGAVSREEIRRARRDAYAGNRIKRGRPAA